MKKIVLASLAALLFLVFCTLGTWQLQRRVWKLDLIDRVEHRIHRPAVSAPDPALWPDINAAQDEYRHVRLQGVFLHDRETWVQANTKLGSGFWVMTPLQMGDAHVTLINRGFVPPEAKSRDTRRAHEPQGEVTVTGLLRISEPKGGFLRDNDPATNRWFSRDVLAITAARGFDTSRVAPYFVDADAASAVPDSLSAEPVGGLTVVSFHNNHGIYAITWFALAAMVGVAGVRVKGRYSS